jgi:nucleoside-diphosphate-sugar epimerase
MKILLTGNLGYLGAIVCRHLRENFPRTEITGYDTGYFRHCQTVPSLKKEEEPDLQFYGDVREFPSALLKGKDAVIHLAAISNDPMGKQFEAVTSEVNFEASVNLARLAKAHGVGAFVFASSCSVYGVDDGTLKNEKSALQPLTAYAQSKIRTEEILATLADSAFSVTALRFATACGFSPRCRLDLVLNDFVASALAQGEISLLSDGSPWRPLIHVEDMARAMAWALRRKSDGAFLSVNVGSEKWNYQIGDLARAVSTYWQNIPVRLNPTAGPDKRSYQVDFSLFRQLAPSHQPQWTLFSAIDDLAKGLRPIIGSGTEFRNSKWIRLRVLADWIGVRRLDSTLRWTTPLEPSLPG